MLLITLVRYAHKSEKEKKERKKNQHINNRAMRTDGIVGRKYFNLEVLELNMHRAHSAFGVRKPQDFTAAAHNRQKPHASAIIAHSRSARFDGKIA